MAAGSRPLLAPPTSTESRARGPRHEHLGTPTREKLDSLAADVDAGTLRVAVQRTYSLADAADALATFSAGTRGKIVPS